MAAPGKASSASFEDGESYGVLYDGTYFRVPGTMSVMATLIVPEVVGEPGDAHLCGRVAHRR